MSSATFDPQSTMGTPSSGEPSPVPHGLPWLRVGDAPDDDLVIGERLGTGGTARVDRARQVVLGRDVAVKRPLAPGDATQAGNLVQEAMITAQIEHPHVVPIYAIGRDEDGPLIVLRELHGRSLAEDLAEDPARGDEALRRRVASLVAICHALEAAHDRGFVHCDVKAANILIGQRGETWLVDWGIAQASGSRAPRLRGTPGYLSPEQAECGVVDARTDVYLLGATLHHVLTGTLRHPGRDLEALLAAARRSEPARWPEGVDTELARLADACCERDPAMRPPGPAAVRRALERWSELSHLDPLVDAARVELDAVDADAVAFRNRLLRVRFVLEAAHTRGHARAREALGAVLDRLIALELDEENPSAARTWASAHPDLDEARRSALEARVAELERRMVERARLAEAGAAWTFEGQGRAIVVGLGGFTVVFVGAVAVVESLPTHDIHLLRLWLMVVLLLAPLPFRVALLWRGRLAAATRGVLVNIDVLLGMIAVERLLLGAIVRVDPVLQLATESLIVAAWTGAFHGRIRLALPLSAFMAVVAAVVLRVPAYADAIYDAAALAFIGTLGVEFLWRARR